MLIQVGTRQGKPCQESPCNQCPCCCCFHTSYFFQKLESQIKSKSKGLRPCPGTSSFNTGRQWVGCGRRGILRISPTNFRIDSFVAHDRKQVLTRTIDPQPADL